jgi:hypothetical protein
MEGRLCNVQYQTRRCKNAITQCVKNKATGEFASVKYIILTLGKIALQLFHRDEMLNTLFFWKKGKFLPVHTVKAYGNAGTALLIRNCGNKWKRIISFMILPLYLWAKPLGAHWTGLVGPTANGNVLENRIISCPCQNQITSTQLAQHTNFETYSVIFL